MDLSLLSQTPPFVFYFLYAWSVLWKGVAMWKAAGLRQKNWFVAILVVNTAGLLEIAYLFFFAKKRVKIKGLRLQL